LEDIADSRCDHYRGLRPFSDGQRLRKGGPEEKEFPYFDERGEVYLGVLHPYIYTQVQVNRSNAVPGTFFDFETDLGLQADQVRFLGQASYRIGKHASFGLTFLDLARSSTRTLNKDITFGDRTFNANATVNAFVNTQYYQLTYRYSFVRNNHNEFGASIGINAANVSTGLRVATEFAGINISTGASAGQGKEQNFIAPVPLLGLFFTSQILPRTFLRNAIQYMDVNAAGFNMKALNYLINIDYNPWKNIGVGVGVYSNRLEVKGGTDLKGKFVYNLTGTQFYVRYFY
jgi:hypothetical protein